MQIGVTLKRTIILITVIISLLALPSVFAGSEDSLTPVLTQEEKDFIARDYVLSAVSIEGIAPHHYLDKDGNVAGIGKRILEEISDMTGLVFEYRLYGTIEEYLNSGADIVFGTAPNYAPEGMILSKPYMKTETILYINSSIDVDHLEGKIYAALRGSDLPEGVKGANTIYFDTREESLDAVEKGVADYGYGNAYSVAFYSLQNGYKNIVTIPKGKESREYCIGFLNEDELLISIINKSIDAIDENRLQNLILDVTSHVDRKLTPSMVLEAYGMGIFTVSFSVIAILLFNLISYLKINKRLRMQNIKYERLSRISNEYLYEYSTVTGDIKLSEKCALIFGEKDNLKRVGSLLKDTLLGEDFTEGELSTIRLPLKNGKEGIFKTVNSVVRGSKGEPEIIIGKLIDVSKESKEREKLILKSQIDGLTGLYNAATSKELIERYISGECFDGTDAYMLLDVDRFKTINDTYGHLMGDKILELTGKSLRQVFRNTDIIGRIGGDEFCVYIKDISSVEWIKERVMRLAPLINREIAEMSVSISAGIVLVDAKASFEKIFIKADEALYHSKRNCGDRITLYGEWREREERNQIGMQSGVDG